MRRSFRVALVCAWSLLAAAQAVVVPTPDKAMSFALQKDSRTWVPKYKAGNSNRILFEMVPEGQTIEAWQEMVAQQIDFTARPLTEHFEGWKTMLQRADPKIEITEERLPDSSILATYNSAAGNEASLRRFIQGSDGIYMLAYHVRPALKQESIWKLWRSILSEASLVPNPEKRK